MDDAGTLEGMTTATEDRQGLTKAAQESGWGHRTSDERGDVFDKATVSVRVQWAGNSISGATLFHNGMYESHTRDGATVRAWLKR